MVTAKPTARASGTNNERTGSSIMNAGMKTAKMHNKISSKGTATSSAASVTARANDGFCSICT